MRIDLLSLFPQQLDQFLRYSIIGRARERDLVQIVCTDFREYSGDKHGKVDDRPFGGGPGMVIRPQPVVEAVEAVEAQDHRPATRILLTPQGRPLAQPLVKELAGHKRLLIIAGHYEGFDERVRLILKPMEISIGDYILSGGEPAAVALVDAVVRLLEGVVGDEESLTEESFTANRLEYPHYTRPREYRGHAVPEVLLNGHHAEIQKWRATQSQNRTQARRPDLLEE